MAHSCDVADQVLIPMFDHLGIQATKTDDDGNQTNTDAYQDVFEGVYDYINGALHNAYRGHRHMSATVREICVKTGSQVAAGDALVVLEAMKMEVNVVAPRAGVLSEIFCAVGDAVAQGALLVRIDDGKKTPPRRVVKKRPARKS